ncbi:MAG: magnesium chelatase subunit D [Ideonella sp.]
MSTAALVAALMAVDPVGLGGVHLRSDAGPMRERWLAQLSGLLPEGTPWRRVPLHIEDDRLLGGLDLSSTLQAGRPVAQRGLLAEADGGIVLLAMAERIDASTAARLAAVLDQHEVVAERHGIAARSASRIGVVALDEGLGDDEQLPARLRERLALALSLAPRARADESEQALFTRADVAAARARLADVRIDEEFVESLCAAAHALGVDSPRASIFACRVARVVAALDARTAVSADDAALAAGLVLAPRATRLPTASEPEAADEAEAESTPGDDEAAAEEAGLDPTPPPSGDDERAEVDAERPATQTGALDDVVLQAAVAAVPRGLLAALAIGQTAQRAAAAAGRVGALQLGRSRGRPAGVRRGEPRGGARLNLIETLRAAAPWQKLRRGADDAGRQSGVRVRREDFVVWRFQQRRETTTVFVVDASGSAALHRLAEAKGAVELLLADCYVRRDSVAVIAFRGSAAELLLPPTRSLVRAKRSLAGLPGGGGTPLAAGLAAAHLLADAVRRRGATPVLVLLTDGRANISLDGTPGRARASDDALTVARRLKADGFSTLLLDTSPQPQQPARELAAAMGARYLPLPHGASSAMSQAVQASRAG